MIKFIKELNKDEELIALIKKQFDEGRLTVEQLSVSLGTGQITLREYLNIIKDEDKESGK